MTPASRIPLGSLHTYALLKIEEQLGRFRDNLLRVREVATSRSTVAHVAMLGGLAGIAWGAWMVWHPLGPIVGGWFAVRIATMVAEESERR